VRFTLFCGKDGKGHSTGESARAIGPPLLVFGSNMKVVWSRVSERSAIAGGSGLDNAASLRSAATKLWIAARRRRACPGGALFDNYQNTQIVLQYFLSALDSPPQAANPRPTGNGFSGEASW
jgi:hypothetical protein